MAPASARGADKLARPCRPPAPATRRALPHHHRRQPAQARLARRAATAVGAVEARGRRARRRASATPCAWRCFDQEHAGIDIVTDGEQTRRHFVTTFIEGLDGVDFAHKRTVRIRNRYDADVPVVTGPVARRQPDLRRRRPLPRARRPTRQVKYTLPGPMTMVDTLYDAHYRSREKLALAFAEILNEEARAIEAAGVDVIQFDEPAFNVYFDEVRDWGIAALERAARGPALQDRGAHLLRLRHQGQHRLEEDAGQRMAAVRGDVPAARALVASARCRSSARTRTCRIDLIAPPRRARTCWSGRSTSPPSGWRRRKKSPRRSGRRSRFVAPERIQRAPTAAWSRCRARSRGASCGRWPRGRRWCAPGRRGDV